MSQSRQVAAQRVGGERGVGRAVDDAAYYPSAPTGGGTGTVTSVDVSGGTTGLSSSGGPIVAAGTLTLGGTLNVANGGTGGINAAAARSNLGTDNASNLASGTVASARLPATADMNARVAVEKAGVAVGTRRTLNFIEGANVTLTMADDAGNEEVDITIAASGGGGSANTGTTTVDFGAFPGTTHATVAVTGQASILSGSLARSWINPTATADHSSDEHVIATSMLDVAVSDIVAGTGFTIHLMARHQGGEALSQPRPNDRGNASTTVGQNATPPQGLGVSVGGTDLNRHYGTYTVAWTWS